MLDKYVYVPDVDSFVIDFYKIFMIIGYLNRYGDNLIYVFKSMNLCILNIDEMDIWILMRSFSDNGEIRV